MPTLAIALRNEIRKLAARELKRAMKPLRRVQRQVKALRLAARGSAKTLARLEGRLLRLNARAARRLRQVRIPGRPGRRPTPESIRTLRARYRMTRLQFAKLLGVSPGSIFGWETGRTLPRGSNLARLAEVRKMGARRARATRAAGRPEPRRSRRRGRRRR